MERSVVVVVGTRPDAIKLIPVYNALKHAGLTTTLCATYQHRDLLDQVFDLFQTWPDVSLNIMQENQQLDYVVSSVLEKITAFFIQQKPSLVVVQGDTSSSLSAALAAYYLNIPVVHVEAGLRTGNTRSPFPEEINRVCIAKLSSIHCAPTPINMLTLLSEGVSHKQVYCVGNTIVDALMFIKKRISTGLILIDSPIQELMLNCFARHQRVVLFTMHRRESFDGGIQKVLTALKHFALAYPDLFFLFPIHPNPHVQHLVKESGIDRIENIHCCNPLSYKDLVYVLMHSWLVMTDSGGLQEEAVSLGKRVIVLRDHTERVEILWEGMGRLVGTDIQLIEKVLDEWYEDYTYVDPLFIYGDGNVSVKIVDIIKQYLTDYPTDLFFTSSMYKAQSSNKMFYLPKAQ